jgi:hypothetical protein
MRRGEVPVAAGFEEVLDAVEVEEEGVTAAVGGDLVVAAADHVAPGAKETAAPDTIVVPTASGLRASAPVALKTL